MPTGTGSSSASSASSARSATSINLAVYTALLHAGAPLPRRGGVLVPRRGHEQLHVEPPLDVPRPARPASPCRGCASSSSRSRRSAPTSRSSTLPVTAGAGKFVGQAIAIVLVTPLNFIGNKLWSFRRRRRSVRGEAQPLPRRRSARARRCAGRVRAGGDDDADRRPSSTARAVSSRRRSSRRSRQPAALTRPRRSAIFEHDPKVAAWLTRYPVKGRTVRGDVRRRRPAAGRSRSGGAPPARSRRASSRRDRRRDSRRGPARRSRGGWRAARPGAFGGTRSTDPWVWGAFCLVFLLGLGDWRRPFSLRNLDLLFLLSPTASLWFFNHGDVFTAVPLFYPCLVWVVLRGIWIGTRPNRGTRGRAALAGLGAARRRRSSSPASASGSTSSART